MSELVLLSIVLTIFLLAWNDFTAMKQYRTLSDEVARMKAHYDHEIADAFAMLEDYINEGDPVSENKDDSGCTDLTTKCRIFADRSLCLIKGGREIRRPLEDWFDAMREKIEDQAVDELIDFAGEEPAVMDKTRSLEQEG